MEVTTKGGSPAINKKREEFGGGLFFLISALNTRGFDAAG